MTLDFISFLTGSDHDTERSRFDNQRRPRCVPDVSQEKTKQKLEEKSKRKENCRTSLTEFLRKTINFVGTSPVFPWFTRENSCRKAGEFSLNKSRDFAIEFDCVTLQNSRSVDIHGMKCATWNMFV
jgi:hypothetical protein